VPFFYYVLHIPLIHLVAVLISLVRTPASTGWLFANHPLLPPEVPDGYRWSLALLYLVTALVVVALYFPCRWYARVKARRVGAEMHLEQTFGVMSEQPSQWRIRYFNIQSDRFSWTANRSIDTGKTWVQDYLRIEARRVGPPRELKALAPARKFSIKSWGAAK
jgi:hypothetical protein